MDNRQGQEHGRRNFLFLVVMIGMLALLLREYFVLVAQVDAPIRGDIREYVAYAWNLLHHHTFSATPPGSAVVVPDAYRGPGYPLFLAVTMLAGEAGNRWYFVALHAQALLGAATVLMGIALGRHWLSRGWSLIAGVLMALWPHHIAATGALLSEVVFGFALMLALLSTAEAARRRSTGWAIAAGVAFGLAWLVNPLILLFPPLVAIAFWRVGIGRQAACMLAIALLFAGAWAGRNATLPPQPDVPGRATTNFVQGSWPLFLRALNDAGRTGPDASPIPRRIVQAVDEETRLVARDPRAGLHSIADRMALDPAYYARWYAFEKPWLLWDWDIRVGTGDVYYHEVKHSPLETHPLLHAIKTTLHALNPAIFLLSMLATVGFIVIGLRRPASAELAPLLVALFIAYVTLVHTIFQAEPRYAIPYRPMQLLLAVAAVAAVIDWLRGRLAGRHRIQPAAAKAESGPG
jgi:4-amino-4-deoxy-L-arabinose transferase-like glycosyltransferase